LPGIREGKKRNIRGEYEQVEERLVQYISTITNEGEVSEETRTLLSWTQLQAKAKEIAMEVLPDKDQQKFKASPGWLSNVLKRHKLTIAR
jgi:hypothetical protein